MKRYIKSFKTLEDKRDTSYPYKYVLKHGIGPGTLPKDVNVGKISDADWYTLVWLDRPLSAKELEFYDIPSETEIDKYIKSYKGIDEIEDDEVYADESDPYHGYRWYVCDCGYEDFHPIDEDEGVCPRCHDHTGGYNEVDPELDPSWYEDITPDMYNNHIAWGYDAYYDEPDYL